MQGIPDFDAERLSSKHLLHIFCIGEAGMLIFSRNDGCFLSENTEASPARPDTC